MYQSRVEMDIFVYFLYLLSTLTWFQYHRFYERSISEKEQNQQYIGLSAFLRTDSWIICIFCCFQIFRSSKGHSAVISLVCNDSVPNNESILEYIGVKNAKRNTYVSIHAGCLPFGHKIQKVCLKVKWNSSFLVNPFWNCRLQYPQR